MASKSHQTENPATWRQLKGDYSYLTMDLKDQPGSAATGDIQFDEDSNPHHEVTIQSVFKLPKKFGFDQTYRYVSAVPALSVKGYNITAVCVGWRPNGYWELSLIGQNLGRPHHFEFGADPRPLIGIRSSVYGKMTWTTR